MQAIRYVLLSWRASRSGKERTAVPLKSLLRAALVTCVRHRGGAFAAPAGAERGRRACQRTERRDSKEEPGGGIARYHRQRGSQGSHSAAELIAERARAYGLAEVQILQFPADGRTFYGTEPSRQAWDAEQGDLTEVGSGAEHTLASYAAQPVALAEDSESADVTAELVDVGGGTQDSDYAGKDVSGKLVLVSAQPGEVQEAAIGKFKAAGIVSYAQNQRTAWWGEDENLVRWGHLDSFSANPTFAFMVSLQTARALQSASGMETSSNCTHRSGPASIPDPTRSSPA